MRALFIPFDWIASERVYGQLPGCRQINITVKATKGVRTRRIAADECIIESDDGLPPLRVWFGGEVFTPSQVSGASGRVGAADGEKIAAAQITHTQHQPTQ